MTEVIFFLVLVAIPVIIIGISAINWTLHSHVNNSIDAFMQINQRIDILYKIIEDQREELEAIRSIEFGITDRIVHNQDNPIRDAQEFCRTYKYL